jgi:hypothetical protein
MFTAYSAQKRCIHLTRHFHTGLPKGHGYAIEEPINGLSISDGVTFQKMKWYK